MTRFAFYGRVSTEDQQDPAASRDWQISRARQLIEPHGHAIVVEYFDIGQSRSLPWKRRPESARLLDDLRQPDRKFDAIVIGEPARAFSGIQYQLTYPVLAHFECGLWIPELGGAVDFEGDAQEMMMALFGGMSQSERRRIKVRVRSAMTSQAAQGRFLGGRPPYGYQLVDDGPHPNPGKAAVGQRAHRLEIDETTAPIVQRIYSEYLGGAGIYAIAEGLTRDGVPCPSAADPARNRHRIGIAWSKPAIKTILANPRYTGRQVWNRQRRDEVLIDVEDVALGHNSKMRWNDQEEWVWSTEEAQTPIIDTETFTRAQLQLGAGNHRPSKRTTRRKNPYPLRGLMICSSCGRRMQGSWNHGRANYRCKLPSEYALANKIEHPPTLYVREEHILPKLDEWIAGVFDPENIDATVALLTKVQGASEVDVAKVEAAKRAIADCDDKVQRLVDGIEAGGPADVLGARIQQVQGDRLAAERALAAAQPASGPITAEQMRDLIEGFGDLAAVLSAAEPEDKAKLYNELGLELTFDAEKRTVKVKALPVYSRTCRRGDLYHYPTRPAIGPLPGLTIGELRTRRRSTTVCRTGGQFRRRQPSTR